MTDNIADTTPTTDTPVRQVTKRGQKLPRITLADVRPVVQTLADLNGPASNKLVAGQLRMSADGGQFKTLWGAAGFYGFRQKIADGKFELTDRGQAFVSGDHEAVRRAAREAVMSTGFGPVVNRFSTSPPNQHAIAGVLHEQCEVPENQAEKLAETLIAAATEADLITDGRFDVAAIEETMASVETIAVSSPPKAPTGAARRSPSTSRSRAPDPVAPERARPRSERSGPFGEVSVVIQIDATKLTPQEIKEVVRELMQQPMTVS
jgi:hypothetical protein